jgi:hypothetical protein
MQGPRARIYAIPGTRTAAYPHKPDPKRGLSSRWPPSPTRVPAHQLYHATTHTVQRNSRPSRLEVFGPREDHPELDQVDEAPPRRHRAVEARSSSDQTARSPTINYELRTGCDLDYVPNVNFGQVDSPVSINLGIGGQNPRWCSSLLSSSRAIFSRRSLQQDRLFFGCRASPCSIRGPRLFSPRGPPVLDTCSRSPDPFSPVVPREHPLLRLHRRRNAPSPTQDDIVTADERRTRRSVIAAGKVSVEAST